MDKLQIAFPLTEEFRKKHHIPTFPVKTSNIAVDDPDWKMRLKLNSWWEAEQLESGRSIAEFTAGSDHNRSEKEYQEFQILHSILLSIGGSETCFPCTEEDMAAILERGYFHNGVSKMMLGEPSRCHSNVCELWERNHKSADVRICTGYALSADGMWRQHSWLAHYYKTPAQSRMRIIETTAKRVAYYGFEMAKEEAEKFSYFNL